jgi:hypothetical protein
MSFLVLILKILSFNINITNNYMAQGSSRDAKVSLAGQEITHNLQNLYVRYPLNKSEC